MKKANIILYADDDIDDRELLSSVFSSLSNQPLIAFSNGEELISFLVAHRDEVCAIVLDINMPLRTGVETLDDIRNIQHFADIPAVIYTTASNPVAQKEIDRLNAFTLTKPSSFEGLVESVKQILAYCHSVENLSASIK